MDEGDLLVTILDEIIDDVAQASDVIAVDGGLIIEVIVDCDGWNVAFDEGFDLWIFEIDRGDDDAIAAAEFGVFVIGEFGWEMKVISNPKSSAAVLMELRIEEKYSCSRPEAVVSTKRTPMEKERLVFNKRAEAFGI